MPITNVAATWNSTGDLNFKRNLEASTGRIELGVAGDGVDFVLYGASTGVKVAWDESANLITCNDDKTYFGSTAASVSSGAYSKKGFAKIKIGTAVRYVQLYGT